MNKTRIPHVFPVVLALVLAVGGIAVAADLARSPSVDRPITLTSGSDDTTPDDSGDRASDARDDQLSTSPGNDDTPSTESDDTLATGTTGATGTTVAEDRPPRTEVREKDGRREVRREVEHDATQTYPVADAGHVTVTRDGATLTIDGADPASGWSHRIDRASGREVEVTFRRGDHRVDFKAEVEGAYVKIRVRERER